MPEWLSVKRLKKKKKKNIHLKMIRTGLKMSGKIRQCPKKNSERPLKAWRTIAQDSL